ncbi:uncharacterized protein AMSG_04138 [Thecamonas trahens ATCC 50062]|uniref:C2 domain-containing protein n=1 Tax=Thecamonas trahens ATCC 50062 TaxID=461836 RepID=A0A0L0D728_THETB|nr:hypothetical protein AMSG_04138 [Thecamonas trahens ATCC 50062]KNC47906.1 hypothetical protein AMSG_04138 [Thecamonas trahens ATCC 50062]|eukprot:XP_013758928.1 hypothetical protein AMSG_04138 [Thecamonas trahens ATCC 50062]
MDSDGATYLQLVSANNAEASVYATFATFEEAVYDALPTYTDTWEQLVVTSTKTKTLALSKEDRKRASASPPQPWNRLPIALSSMSDLKVLILAHNAFSSLPPDLGLLSNLLYLDMAHNVIDSVSASVLCSCSALQTLSLAGNKLTAFPDLSSVSSLTSLNLSGNAINAISASGPLIPHSLRILDLAANGLKKISGTFLAHHGSLTSLSLANNPKLKALPALSFRFAVSSLRNLDLSTTAVSWLPAPVCARLRKLETLNLLDTAVAHLPPQFDSLVRLHTISALNFTLSADSGLDVKGSLHHFFRLCGQTALPLFRSAFADLLLTHEPNTYDVIRAGAAPRYLDLLRSDVSALVESAINVLSKLLSSEHNKAELLCAGLIEALGPVLATAPTELVELATSGLVLFAEHGGTRLLASLSTSDIPSVARFAADALSALAVQIPAAGMLQVRVLEAMQLVDPSTGKSPSSAYAVLRVGTEKTTTEARKAPDGAPAWSRNAQLNVGIADAMGRIITVKLYNRRTLRKDVFLGSARLPVLTFLDGAVVDNWFQLRPPDSRVSSEAALTGYVHMQIQFTSQASSYFENMAQNARRLASSEAAPSPSPLPAPALPIIVVNGTPGSAPSPALDAPAIHPEPATYSSMLDALDGDARLYEILTLGLDASCAVYFDSDTDAFLHREAFTKVQYTNRHSEQKYFYATRRRPEATAVDLYVSFMGTYSLADAAIDFNVLAHDALNGRIHAGFAQRAYAIPLLPLLEFLRPPSTTAAARRGALVLCGHSLGGAVAVIVFLRLIVECSITPDELRRIHVVTVGQPLVGDTALAAYVHALGVHTRIHAIVNHGDSVACFSSASPRIIAQNLIRHAKDATVAKLRQLAQERAASSPSADEPPSPAAASESDALNALMTSPSSVAVDVLTHYIAARSTDVFFDFTPFGISYMIEHPAAHEGTARYDGADFTVTVASDPAVVKRWLDMPPEGLSTYNLDQHKLYYYFQNWEGLGPPPSATPDLLSFPLHSLASYSERYGGFGDDGLALSVETRDEPVSYAEVSDVVDVSNSADLAVDLASELVSDLGTPSPSPGPRPTSDTASGGGAGAGSGSEPSGSAPLIHLTTSWAPVISSSHAVFDSRTASIEVILFGRSLLFVSRLKFRGDDFDYEPVFLTDTELRFRLRWLPAVYGKEETAATSDGSGLSASESGGRSAEVAASMGDKASTRPGSSSEAAAAASLEAAVKLGSYESLTLRVISHFGESRVKLNLAQHAKSMSRVARVARKFWVEEQRRAARASKLMAALPPAARASLPSHWTNPGAVFAISWQGLTNALASVASTIEHTDLVESLASAYLTSSAFQEYLAESGDVQLQFSHFAVRSISFPAPRVAMDALHNKVGVALAGIAIELEAAFSVVRLTQFLSYTNVGVTVSISDVGGSLELNVVETADDVLSRAAEADDGSDDGELLTEDLVAVMAPPASFALRIGKLDVDFGLELTDDKGEVLASKDNWGFSGFVLSQFSGYIKSSISKALDSVPIEAALISELTRVFLEGKPGTHIPLAGSASVLTADYSLVRAPPLKREAASSMLCTGHRGLVRTYGPNVPPEHYADIPPPRPMDAALSMSNLHDAVVALSPAMVTSVLLAGWHAGFFALDVAASDLPDSLADPELFAHYASDAPPDTPFHLAVAVTSPPSVVFDSDHGICLCLHADFTLLSGDGDGTAHEPVHTEPFVIDVSLDPTALALGDDGLAGASIEIRPSDGVAEFDAGLGPVAAVVRQFRTEIHDFLVLAYSSRLLSLVVDWLRASPLLLLDSVKRVVAQSQAEVALFPDALVISFVVPEYVLDEREVAAVVATTRDLLGWGTSFPLLNATASRKGNDSGDDAASPSPPRDDFAMDSFLNRFGAWLERHVLVHRHGDGGGLPQGSLSQPVS